MTGSPATDALFPVHYPLFVYGTLKPGKCNYAPFLAGQTSAEQPATLSGAALYTQGPYPYLVVDPDLAAPAEHVTGNVITLRSQVYEAVMLQVDRLEDYIPDDEYNEYERVVREVQTAEGPVQVWTYVAARRVLEAIRTGGPFHKIAGGIWAGA